MRNYRLHVCVGSAVLILAVVLVALIGCGGDDNVVAPNSPPTVPVIDTANGAPADSAVNVPINPILRWTCSDPDGDDLQYDVYFQFDADPHQVGGNLTQTDFATYLTGYNITYHWRVVARDSKGAETSSPIWSFTTEPDPSQ